MKFIFSIITFFAVSLCYSQVKVGKTTWAADNLSITKYNDGSPIRFAKNLDDWDDAAIKKEGAYFIRTIKGKKQFYYNYHAIRNKKGFLPKGFRFPKTAEFDTLIREFEKKGDALVKKFQLSPTGIISYDTDRKYHIWDEEYLGFWMSWDFTGKNEEGEKYEDDYYLNSNLGCGAYMNYNKNCINSTFPFDCSGSDFDRNLRIDAGGGNMTSLGYSVRLVVSPK